VVVVVAAEPAVVVATGPPLLEAGVVAGAPDPALLVPVGAAAVESPLAVAVGVPPVVGEPVTGFCVVVSPPQPNSAAPATKAVDAQSRCEFFMIFLRDPCCQASVL
jgi:hypothetical protein